MSKKFYIYLITNQILNKSYIGSRIDYNCKPEDDNYMGSSKHLDVDFEIYGTENFKKEIIKVYTYKNNKHLLNKETEYILKYNTLSPNGYNYYLPNKYPGFYMNGSHLSEKTKEKISIGLKKAYKEGRKRIPDYKKEKHPMFGRKHKLESKLKISQIQIGKKLSDETKQKMSLSSLNKEKSIKHRNNISKGRKGIVFSEEHKRKLSESHKGIINNISDIGRKKISSIISNINNIRILCIYCNKEFNPGNYGRHIKCKHSKI
jgi:group I intron endonuclease